MMLYELFSWVESSETEMFFEHLFLTRSAYKSEQKLALDKRRELRTDVYTSRQGAIVEGATKRLENHDAYIAFLTFCSDELGDLEEYSSFLLVLKYLLQIDFSDRPFALIEEKITSIFRLL